MFIVIEPAEFVPTKDSLSSDANSSWTTVLPLLDANMLDVVERDDLLIQQLIVNVVAAVPLAYVFETYAESAELNLRLLEI